MTWCSAGTAEVAVAVAPLPGSNRSDCGMSCPWRRVSHYVNLLLANPHLPLNINRSTPAAGFGIVLVGNSFAELVCAVMSNKA